MTCAECGRPLVPDEIAATRKLVNRGAARFYCVSCLARIFDVREQDILDRIAWFRSQGCTLFAPAPTEKT